jgi:hypothetical protein
MKAPMRIAGGLLRVILMVGPGRNLLADGFRLPDQDAFATARGEAFVATADNASAIYYNPAGISELKGWNFRAGIYFNLKILTGLSIACTALTSIAHDFYTGGRHEMLHETNRRDVITNLLVWLAAVLDKAR